MVGPRAPKRPDAALPVGKDPPTAAVVLSELNSKTTIRRCVDSLLQQDYPTSRYSVVVVDGGSTDGTWELLEGSSRQGLSARRAPGCSESEGQRLGTAEVDAELTFFTNSDVYVPTDWIRRHVLWHLQGYDVVAGAVFQTGDPVNFSRNVRTTGTPRTTPTQGAGFGFANFSVRTRTLRDCGGIRPLSSQQDAEFILRALKFGASAIIDPAIEVEHDHPLGTLQRSFLRSYGYRSNHSIVEGSAASGKPSAGSSGVGPWELWMPRIVRELLGIEPWAAYRAFAPRVPPRMRRPGFTEFLWYRIWGFTVPEVLAFGFQSLSHRSDASVRDIHRIRAT
jgi:GT2 family glycosyltransferase